MTVRLQAGPFDVGAELTALTAGRTDTGAVVSFTGLCRDGGPDRRILAMELDHYPALALAELDAIEAEATTRWPLDAVLVIHRFGRLMPGEVIVLVAVASRRRAAAFEAASFIMDVLKTHAPFWKREETEADATWVVARQEDDAAARRWNEPG